MKHFGRLKDVEFSKSNERDIADFLVKEGLFEIKIEASGNSSNIKDGILELNANMNTAIVEPSQVLVDEFYAFIMNEIFKHDILKEKIDFFSLFNNQIFGLEPLEQKKIALEHFNRIYKENYNEVITLFSRKVSDSGIKHIYNYGKLQMFYYQLNGYKRNLADKIKLNNYLIGDRDFFTIDNLIENYDIINELEFEIFVQILVELNDRFQFEEDLFFTKIKTEKDRYNKYTHIFKTFESLQFTSRKIENFDDNKKAHIESLYQILIEQELIKDHKENFIEFIKNEYDLNISKIISYDEKENYTHDDRVKLFIQEWLTQASKKE